MIKAWHLFRVAMGVIYFVFGLNGFFNFLTVPEQAAEGKAFLGALIGTGYMLVAWKSVEITGGFLLLINRFVPLALILVAPITVNIFLYHLFLDRSGLPIGTFLLITNILLAFGFRKIYACLFKAKNHLEF